MNFLKQKIKLPSTNYHLLTTNRGFTLIELLVVFSLTAILAGIGIASFSNYNKLQQLSQGANSAQLLINQARFNSLSVVKKSSDSSGVSQNCGSQALNGYYVEVFNATSELRLYLDCSTLSPALIKSVALPKNLTFDPRTTCSIIRFNSLTAMPGGVPCSIILNGYGQQKTISVDAGGNTSIQ
jgi:prepilin-type N-terminal cleavage/methylation domain-containing protein